MFSQTVSEQSAQVAALEAQVDAALGQSYTYYNNGVSTLGLTQATAESISTPTPSKKYYWWDGTQIRGVYGALYDYFVPLYSSRGSLINQTSLHENAMQRVIWLTRTQFLVLASWYTTTAGSFLTYTRQSALDNVISTFNGASNQRVVMYNYVRGEYLYFNTSDNTLRTATGVGGTSLGTAPSSPTIAVMADNGDVFYQLSASLTTIKRRTVGGTVTDIVTGFSGLYHMLYDNVNNKLILFSHTPPSSDSTAYKVDPDGSNLTVLVPTGAYAAGANVSNYHYMGAFVTGGFLYVPVPGSKYLNVYRKYDIAAGTYTTELFDFGLARPILESVRAEAQTHLNNSGGYWAAQQAQYWGTQYYAYPLERLLHIERAPDNTAWLLTYETGQNSPLPGSAAGIAWAVLPDDGCSKKVYPLTESTNGRGDVITLASQTYDTAVKEMNLSWLSTPDYTNLEIEFDSGLAAATETIRIQFDGDIGANYEFSFYRNAVSTISNTTSTVGVPQNYLDLYGVSSGATLGGRYVLKIPHGLVSESGALGVLIEGVSSTGAVTTGSINSILGTGKWTRSPSRNVASIRVFLSGSTASFPAGATIRATAWRTRYPQLNGNGAEV